MKVFALMIRNVKLKVDWYLDSVWVNRDLLEDHIEQMKILDCDEREWEYKIETTVLYKF